jgi:cytochrome c
MRRIACVALLVVVVACHKRREKYQNMAATGGGNADRGEQLVTTYGCTSCHDIPGVNGPKGMVGPPLGKMAVRQYIADARDITAYLYTLN